MNRNRISENMCKRNTLYERLDRESDPDVENKTGHCVSHPPDKTGQIERPCCHECVDIWLLIIGWILVWGLAAFIFYTVFFHPHIVETGIVAYCNQTNTTFTLDISFSSHIHCNLYVTSSGDC